MVKERDDLRAYAAQCSLNADNANISLQCACDELATMQAERDALKATVERVRRLLDGMHASCSQWRFDLERALAPQGEVTCALCDTQAMHRWGTGCTDRRGTTSFNGRGRREREDRHLTYEYWSNDRRRRTRRGGGGT